MLIMYDFYLIKDTSSHFNEVFNVFNKELGVPPLGFSTKEYNVKEHEKMMHIIKSQFVNENY
jgi:hypothetical protein